MKALELADSINAFAWPDERIASEAAAELRRLAEVNAELLEVIQEIAPYLSGAQKIRASIVIAKAKEQQ